MNIGITSNPHTQTETRPGWLQRLQNAPEKLIAPILALGVGIWLWQAELGMWAAVAALFISLILVIRVNTTWREIAAYVLGMVVLISAIDYLGWRFRLINMHGWWIGIPLFAAELFGALHVLGLQYTLYPRQAIPLHKNVDPFKMPVFIMIPTVNEGVDVLRWTINGAIQARARYLEKHPHGKVHIVVCNDGLVAGYADWREVEELAEALGVQCITRTVKGGAKAGNIENARQTLKATGDSLMVIFDADQVAHPDFLVKTIPPFADRRVGWVQTSQEYGNVDNAIARWSHDQQALFYRILCPTKSNLNAMFICGTNVVIRTSALDEIGGLPQDSVTEDFAASIELHPRWMSVFVDEKLAEGIGPMDLRSYFKQQRRWAMGTLGVMRSHWKHIFLPGHGGLSLPQRVQYALACTHYISGTRDLIYVIAPIAFIITGTPAVVGSDLDSFLTHFIPYFIASQLAFWFAAWGKSGMRGIVIGFGSFPVLVEALLSVISGRKIGFQVTSKKQLNDSNVSQIRVHIVFLLASIGAIILGVTSNHEASSVAVTIIWLIYQALMFAAVIWLAVADNVRKHAVWRSLDQSITATFNFAMDSSRRAAMRLAVVGIFTTAVGAALILPNVSTPAQAFAPIVNRGTIEFGVKLPYDLLNTQIPVVQDEIGVMPQVVGRTQEINDRFDGVWAETLASVGARPWVTLLFSQPGVEAYYASLTAIANGVHDEALTEWARAIAEYQLPVYLTVLPHVDRNWSVSSAVTNNGIPADVSRAWTHIQDVFAEAGANNVAWVWAPADPIHDEEYAPPIETIDLVLMTLIRYPDTEWAIPADELTALQNAYPQTPLIIEVSAAGDPVRKAAYFEAFHEAVLDLQNLYAVIYYEGSPRPDATANDHVEWSMVSDPMTRDAIRALVQDITD